MYVHNCASRLNNPRDEILFPLHQCYGKRTSALTPKRKSFNRLRSGDSGGQEKGPYTRQKAKSKYRNCIWLGRASQKQSSDTRKTPYDRVKRCRERKINIKASECVNVDAVIPRADYSQCVGQPVFPEHDTSRRSFTCNEMTVWRPARGAELCVLSGLVTPAVQQRTCSLAPSNASHTGRSSMKDRSVCFFYYLRASDIFHEQQSSKNSRYSLQGDTNDEQQNTNKSEIWNYFPYFVTNFTGRMSLSDPVLIYAGRANYALVGNFQDITDIGNIDVAKKPNFRIAVSRNILGRIRTEILEGPASNFAADFPPIKCDLSSELFNIAPSLHRAYSSRSSTHSRLYFFIVTLSIASNSIPKRVKKPRINAARLEHCTPVPSLARSGDGALDVRANVVLIAGALLGPLSSGQASPLIFPILPPQFLLHWRCERAIGPHIPTLMRNSGGMDARVRDEGVLREKPTASASVRHVYPHAKLRVNPTPGNRTQFAAVGGEYSNRYTTVAPRAKVHQIRQVLLAHLEIFHAHTDVASTDRSMIMAIQAQCILNGSWAAGGLRLVSDELGNIRLDSGGGGRGVFSKAFEQGPSMSVWVATSDFAETSVESWVEWSMSHGGCCYADWGCIDEVSAWTERGGAVVEPWTRIGRNRGSSPGPAILFLMVFGNPLESNALSEFTPHSDDLAVDEMLAVPNHRLFTANWALLRPCSRHACTHFVDSFAICEINVAEARLVALFIHSVRDIQRSRKYGEVQYFLNTAQKQVEFFDTTEYVFMFS
ncbi:hypothetical protein PR048_003562 [Dryococelus australis]|uniref:Uncharacterized protein n=1 Tax=Dryococelus australis TaxID=614101 RepID=A0ABQ9INI8_9NEOP|nr:hypothetical protein PR048_003562 [Dryococelus australis]